MSLENNVKLIGNLGNDVDLINNNGTFIANVSIATKRRIKTVTGEWINETDWHSLVSYGKLAENMAKFLKKGSFIAVEGVLYYDKWTDKSNGIKREKAKIKVDAIKFLESKNNTPQNSNVNITPEEDEDDLPF